MTVATTAPRSRAAAFTVDGRFLTEHARRVVFEFSCEEGIRFLTNSLHGITYEQVVDVLAGRSKFTGNSRVGVNIAPERKRVQARVAAQYRQVFAGVWYDRSSNRNWIPYAYVIGGCQEDMLAGAVPNRWHQKPHCAYLDLPTASGISAMRYWGDFRSVAYMDDRIEDRMVRVALPQIGLQSVLWRQFPGVVPLWWDRLREPQLAIVDWMRTHGIPQRRDPTWLLGGSRHLDSLKGQKEREEEHQEEAKPRPLPELKGEFFKTLLPPGLPDYVADGLTRAMTSKEDIENPEPTKDLKAAKWAWISPDGKVYACRGYMDHIPMAHALARVYSIDLALFKDNAEQALTTMNWIKTGRNNSGELYAYGEKKASSRLKETVYDWLIAQEADPDLLKRWVDSEDGFDY